MKLRHSLAALTAVLGVALLAAPAQATAQPALPFAAQAHSVGLTDAQAQRLQREVDREVTATGGTQVALNKVAWPGGDTVLVLPGERYARNLSEPPHTVRGCVYQAFCIYQYNDYSGSRHDYIDCHEYHNPNIFFTYVNNQTPGTRAEFKDFDHSHTAYTMPAFYEGTTSLGNHAVYITPC